MITVSLHDLEHRLEIQDPSHHWKCRSIYVATESLSADQPHTIVIVATGPGASLTHSPMYVSGDLVTQWGLEPSARRISDEMTAPPSFPETRGLHCDRLAEN